MAEVLPYMQVNIPAPRGGAGRDARGSASPKEGAEPLSFESLMAECSASQEPGGAAPEARRYPALEQVYSAMQGSLFPFGKPVLDLLASMAEDLQTSAPEVLDLAEDAAAGLLDRLSAELSEATASAHQGQIAAEQTRLRVEDLQRRALEELSLEPEQLLAEFGPETLVPMLPLDPDQVEKAAAAEPSAYVRAEQERALAKAQKDLEKLGRVNPLALEEHEALASRHKFLVDQVQDLKQSKADLLRIVQDVDRLVEEAFASAFAETRDQFEHVFGVLFPGGVGDLVLTDPDDMLSTGIEIEARPAGKKVKRLSLLSGGERSLAAIAFLVAIFKARPSPFYVMDEVEAALDDVNLTRLLAIFKELQETSQLIVVTHQKRTMEIADALYGVTMRDGVTTVVSQRLAD